MSALSQLSSSPGALFLDSKVLLRTPVPQENGSEQPLGCHGPHPPPTLGRANPREGVSLMTRLVMLLVTESLLDEVSFDLGKSRGEWGGGCSHRKWPSNSEREGAGLDR